jgi:hypothetical protein
MYAASQSAKLNAGMQAFQLVRNGLPVMKAAWWSVKPGTRSDPVLKAGDGRGVQQLVTEGENFSFHGSLPRNLRFSV